MPGPTDQTQSEPAAPGRESYRASTLVVLLRLHWFIRLRWLFVTLALGVLAVERFAFPAARRPWEVLLVVLGVGAINVFWGLASRLLDSQLNQTEEPAPAAVRSARLFANAQVSTDLLLLTVILHLTGGIENPMSVFYLFHVAISGLLLRTHHALLQSAWAVLLYATMSATEWLGWLQHHPLLPHLGSAGLYEQYEYVLLLVAVNAVAVFGTLYFMLRIAKTLDSREGELINANTALEQSRRAIQDLQARRARFMQTAAHQLKSPLAIVQTLANLIRDGIVTDEEGIQATCAKISRRAQEGIGQVSELLTFARVQEADPARHRQSKADVRETALELCRRFKPVAERKDVELTWWVPDVSGLAVPVDPQDLKDCIGNLIENAIKYTPGPGRVRVALTVKKTRNKAVSVGVHVSDTGIGFDPKLLRTSGRQLGEEPVFDAFQRGTNVIAAGIPGTGLGLSIVREVIEQAGGRIWLMSRLGAGSSFTVTLPVCGAVTAQPTVRNTRSAEVMLDPTPNASSPGQPAPPPASQGS